MSFDIICQKAPKMAFHASGLVIALLFSLPYSALAATKAAQKTPPTEVDVGARFDCLHNFNLVDGSTQDCIAVSGLRLSLKQKLEDQMTAYVRLDPFGTVSESQEESPLSEQRVSVRETDLNFIDDYAIIWQPRPSLMLSLEEYGGATQLPSTSGLSLASQLDHAGWDQTAFAITYLLGAGEGMKVKLVYGNGEGENAVNLDPQQYFGFELNANFLKGFIAKIGLSRDFNSQGSLRHAWVLDRYEKECEIDTTSYKETNLGFLTSRLAAAIEMDGQFESARGLKVGLGWQQNVMSDLDKNKRTLPSVGELAECERIDIDNFFVEDPNNEKANIIETNTIAINASYRILDTYFLGFDFEQRTTSSRDVKFFQPCERFVETSCETGGQKPQSSLKQTAYTFGFGMDINPDLILTLEYHTASFDQLYNKIYYDGPNGATDSFELFNARIAYHWN